MTGRSVPLWVGATPNAAIPPRVKARVFVDHGGRCHITGRLIRPGDEWDCDHIVALINGGTHSEDNLAPALRSAHRQKTADDVAEKAKVARVKARHLGIRKPSRMAGAKTSPYRKKLDGTVICRATGEPITKGR